MNDINAQSSAASELPLLRVQFSTEVDTDTLYLLHGAETTEEIAAQLPTALRDLLEAVNGERLRSVYQLTRQEITNDTYGFARDFQLVLHPDTDVDAALTTLQKSPLVKEVRPIRMRRSS